MSVCLFITLHCSIPSSVFSPSLLLISFIMCLSVFYHSALLYSFVCLSPPTLIFMSFSMSFSYKCSFHSPISYFSFLLSMFINNKMADFMAPSADFGPRLTNSWGPPKISFQGGICPPPYVRQCSVGTSKSNHHTWISVCNKWKKVEPVKSAFNTYRMAVQLINKISFCTLMRKNPSNILT